MKIVEAHKGCYEYSTHFTGLAGHGSEPDKGVNAVEYAVKYIDKLMKLREELKKNSPKKSIFNPPYTTLQIGGINGGIARNVIADKCSVDWELRPIVKKDGDFVNLEMDNFVKNKLLPEMKNIFPNASIKKEIIGEIIGFDQVKKSSACNLMANIMGDNSKNTVSFGTEAGLFQEINISTVVCGPGSIDQAHKVDEFITFDQLKLCIKMLDGVKNYLKN
jgi:acetylornithine deacetylase